MEKPLKKNKQLTLYQLLNIDKSSTKEEIRKAYKILAMHFHPDKNSDSNTTEKFQEINKAYEILSDPKKKEAYDKLGIINGDINIESTYNYFKDIYPEVNFDVIKEYSLKYRESEEEKQDLISFYIKNKGDVTNVLEWIPFSVNEDIPRFLEIFNKLISENTLTGNQKFKKSIKKIKLLKDEISGDEDKFEALKKQILENKQKRIDHLEEMEKKYGGEKKKKKLK